MENILIGKLQYEAARLVTGAIKEHLVKLKERRIYRSYKYDL